MKITPKLPRGFRYLKHGEIIRYTDKFWSWNKGPWKRFGGCVNDAEESIGLPMTPQSNPIIRRSK